MAIATTPPSGIILRFSLLTEAMKRGLIEGIRRPLIARRGPLGPLIGMLLHYLMDTRRRLAALHARFAAGKLQAAPRRSTDPRPAADRSRPRRRPPAIPPGPVLLTVFRAGFDEMLQALLDDPEMRALLAASPQAGRILRPLWRKLSPRPLPAVLRLPPRPRRPKAARALRPESAGANPSPQPLVCSSQPKPLSRGEGETTRPAWWTYPVSLWADPAPAAGPEPTPCLPPWPD
jgi:hypothetical protein